MSGESGGAGSGSTPGAGQSSQPGIGYSAQATRVIHFTKLYGSLQLYLECNCGDVAQDYMDGWLGFNPDFSKWTTGTGGVRARVTPKLLQSAGDNELTNPVWKIGNVTLAFKSANVTGDPDLFDCDTTGFSGIFARRVFRDASSNIIGECLEITGNFAQALQGQSTILYCTVDIENDGEFVMKAQANLPVTVRKVTGNDWSVHIVPGGGKELGIQAEADRMQLLCYPEAAISKGVKAVTSDTGILVVWDYYGASGWTPVPATVFASGTDPDTVKTPLMKESGKWRSIVVPCGAVNSQLLVRASLYDTETPAPDAVPVATDTATIYDNSDTVYIDPNPNREEAFQIGNAEMEKDVVYAPKVMKGEGNDVTASYDFEFTLLGSAGEEMKNAGVFNQTAGTFTISKDDALQAGCDMTLVIRATHK